VEHLTLGGVYRSEDKGANWVRMSNTNPRPSYYSQIRVDPNNEQKVWVLGVPLFMSEDGGKNFTQDRAGRIHTDFHAMWIDPANSDHVAGWTTARGIRTIRSGDWQSQQHIVRSACLRSCVRHAQKRHVLRGFSHVHLAVEAQRDHPASHSVIRIRGIDPHGVEIVWIRPARS